MHGSEVRAFVVLPLLLPPASCLYAPAVLVLFCCSRFSTVAQSMFEKKASMYFKRSAGL